LKAAPVKVQQQKSKPEKSAYLFSGFNISTEKHNDKQSRL